MPERKRKRPLFLDFDENRELTQAQSDAMAALSAAVGSWAEGGADTAAMWLIFAAVMEELHAEAAFLGRSRGASMTGEGFTDTGPQPMDISYGAQAWQAEQQWAVPFAQDLINGRYGHPGVDPGLQEAIPPKPAGVLNRMSLYVDKAVATANETAIAVMGPDALYWWKLDDGARHCTSCPGWAMGGPYTLETLPAIPGDGTSECGTHCACWLEVEGLGPMFRLARRKKTDQPPDAVPNASKAFVHDDKILRHLLKSKEKDDKRGLFEGYGFSAEDPETLRKALLEHIQQNPGVQGETTGHGVKYTVEADMITPNGRNPYMRSVWQVDQGTDFPRFVTAYKVDRPR